MFGERLTDFLNGQERFRLHHVECESLADGHLAAVDSISVERNDLLAVLASGPRGSQKQRVSLQSNRLQVCIGPYLILGRLHTEPGTDAMASVLQRDPMIPFTNATIAYEVGGLDRRARHRHGHRQSPPGRLDLADDGGGVALPGRATSARRSRRSFTPTTAATPHRSGSAEHDPETELLSAPDDRRPEHDIRQPDAQVGRHDAPRGGTWQCRPAGPRRASRSDRGSRRSCRHRDWRGTGRGRRRGTGPLPGRPRRRSRSRSRPARRAHPAPASPRS